ncbi:ras-related protein Rab-15-like isoform X2 [Acanthaster planci]|uniref:Ras-related protein Rab-12 n=1 Tax=Acanthaster planci TaxID=133434 RepID=A0A8B7YVC8_ACAPL|nr:ras-related protein Rab-15-like isoform X2 [Acanthaster planci]
MAKQYDILIRMLMIGDSGVGKTCMLCRFTDEGFITPHISTIGIDFKMKNLELEGNRIRVQIWDTAGQERYDTITTQYFRRAQGFMLVYDITSEASFLNIQKWMTMVAEHAGPDADMFLVGNKSDAEALRTVSFEEGERFARANGMSFIETSAHNSSNIHEAFVMLTKQIMRRRKKSIDRQMENIRLYAREDSRAETENPTQGKSACC